MIPIPLRSPDGDGLVDLQEVLHRAYDGPGYEYFIYAGMPEPSLPAADAEWRDSSSRHRLESDAVSPRW